MKIHTQLTGVQDELELVNNQLERIATCLERLVAVAELVTLPIAILRRVAT